MNLPKRSRRPWLLERLFPQSRQQRRRTRRHWQTLLGRLIPASRGERLKARMAFAIAALLKRLFPLPRPKRRVRDHQFQRLDCRAMLDGDPWITVDSPSATAPDSLVFTVAYGNMPEGSTVSYSTQGGNPGFDYTPVSDSSGASGNGSFTVSVPTIDEQMGGSDQVELDASGGGANASGMGTINEPSGGISSGGGGGPSGLSLHLTPSPLHTGDSQPRRQLRRL